MLISAITKCNPRKSVCRAARLSLTAVAAAAVRAYQYMRPAHPLPSRFYTTCQNPPPRPLQTRQVKNVKPTATLIQPLLSPILLARLSGCDCPIFN